MSVIRLLALDDAPALAGLLRVNREFHAPWDPVRSEDYYTAEGQREVVAAALAQHEQGLKLPYAILDAAGQVMGRINVNDIVYGAFRSGHLGYWLGEAATGRGLATAAVREIVRLAFGDVGLHRLQAGTVLHNVRSQRVLERAGFTRIGVAPEYLKIAGKWQDHILYQLINPVPV